MINHDKRQGNSIETAESVFNLLCVLVYNLIVLERYIGTVFSFYI